MISQLRGEIITIDHDAGIAVIDVQGVGYQLFCDRRTLDILARGEAEQIVCVETHVREDHIHLYGFDSLATRHWFRMLLGVQGV
ncbi:MAG: OB-fold domain-containing protein, partial [Pseudomonadota bacterium]